MPRHQQWAIIQDRVAADYGEEEMIDLPHQMDEDTIMKNLVAELLACEEGPCDDDDCGCEEVSQKEEDTLLVASKTPIYPGDKFSILRALLEILNL
ncbi:hypothetical protein GOP47_0020560 [Adiantum capillus-veneris]|uniref:Uncharacterized protein n=1 Tax=Adiantum capillus-veneris TaxID=13818 RepID=A0A9D4U9L9_ADICA|nr:hypothetical protein GOP47_0020560 [Adiantum capillus-veneris]